MPRPGEHSADRSWERKWRQRAPPEFTWHIEEPPSELSRLLETGGFPAGAALDLGCGAGAAARHISRYLSPTAGVDLAMGAVRRAQALAREEGVAPSFVVAEAPTLPFRDGRFTLIFDRGCLHNIPRPLWPTYFREIDRLLVPGGVLQLFLVQPALPPLLSRRGLRMRLRHPGRMFRSQSKRAMLFDQRLRSHLPPSFDVVEKSRMPFDGGGRRRTIVHLLVRKPQP